MTPETTADDAQTNEHVKKVQQAAQAAIDELNRAFREHAELARKQYGELTEKYGDPKEQVEHLRTNTEKLIAELETHAKDVAERVKRYVPIGSHESSTIHTAGSDEDVVVEDVGGEDEGDDTPEVPTGE